MMIITMIQVTSSAPGVEARAECEAPALQPLSCEAHTGLRGDLSLAPASLRSHYRPPACQAQEAGADDPLWV